MGYKNCLSSSVKSVSRWLGTQSISRYGFSVADLRFSFSALGLRPHRISQAIAEPHAATRGT